MSLLSRLPTHVRIVHSQAYPNLKAEDEHALTRITSPTHQLIANAFASRRMSAALSTEDWIGGAVIR